MSDIGSVAWWREQAEHLRGVADRAAAADTAESLDRAADTRAEANAYDRAADAREEAARGVEPLTLARYDKSNPPDDSHWSLTVVPHGFDGLRFYASHEGVTMDEMPRRVAHRLIATGLRLLDESTAQAERRA